MSTRLLFAVLEGPGPGAAIACFNLIVALALVSFGLLLALAISSVAWFCDRPAKARVPGKSEPRATT
jgi:hypothetical protein